MTDDAHFDDDVLDDREVAGLAGERTNLAWSRSGLALFICLAALAKRALPEFSTLDARFILGAALVIGAIAWSFALLWARLGAAPMLSGRGTSDAHALRAVAYGTAAIGAVATVIAFFPAR